MTPSVRRGQEEKVGHARARMGRCWQHDGSALAGPGRPRAGARCRVSGRAALRGRGRLRVRPGAQPGWGHPVCRALVGRRRAAGRAERGALGGRVRDDRPARGLAPRGHGERRDGAAPRAHRGGPCPRRRRPAPPGRTVPTRRRGLDAATPSGAKSCRTLGRPHPFGWRQGTRRGLASREPWGPHGGPTGR